MCLASLLPPQAAEGGFTRQRKMMRTTPLVPFASRATASLGRFFGCAKTATLLSPALTHPTGVGGVAFGSSAGTIAYQVPWTVQKNGRKL